MDRFTVLESVVAPLDRANIDTDQIIPQRYLQSIKRAGMIRSVSMSSPLRGRPRPSTRAIRPAAWGLGAGG